MHMWSTTLDEFISVCQWFMSYISVLGVCITLFGKNRSMHKEKGQDPGSMVCVCVCVNSSLPLSRSFLPRVLIMLSDSWLWVMKWWALTVGQSTLRKLAI